MSTIRARVPARKAWSAAWLASLLVLLCMGTAHAVPDWIKKQLHKFEEYKVLVISGKHPGQEVDKLVASPHNYKIVVWQVLPEDTKAADTDRLMEWVKDGGSLWFQDCRLAPSFGLQPNPLLKSDLREPSDMHKNNKDIFRDYSGDYSPVFAHG